MKEEVKKLYYSTSEIAKILEVTVTIINYWISHFRIPCSGGGNRPRRIRAEYLEWFYEIYRMMSIEEWKIKKAKVEFKRWKDERRIKNSKNADGVGDEGARYGTVSTSTLERYLYPDEDNISGGVS